MTLHDNGPRKPPAARSWMMLIWMLGATACVAQSGCSASTLSSVELSRVSTDDEELFPHGDMLVGPGPTDTANRFVPTVRVSTALTTPQGLKSYKPCSGTLIHPRLVVTAGHCVCWSRLPTPQDQPSPALSQAESHTRGKKGVRTRAEELRGVTLTEIIDTHSSCATSTTVTTVVYGTSKKGRPEAQVIDYTENQIVVHPDLQILKGTRAGRTETVWSNADLALIFLKEPVEIDLPSVMLPTAEVQVGDAIIMVGYGPGDSSISYGARQFGSNKVTRIFALETGSVVFRAEEQKLPDGSVAAHTGFGDSGGACVKRANPQVFVGVVSIGAQTKDGGKMSVFTSVYSYRDWLEEALRRANKT
jgi:trypsin